MYPPFQFRKSFFDPPEEEELNPIFKNIVFGNMDHNPQGPIEPQAPPSFMDAYRELINRGEGPATGAYRQFLETGYPTEEAHQPTKMQRLGAILSGAAASLHNPGAGYHTARSIVDQPYQRAVQRYGLEGARLREAANFEETSNKNRLGAINAQVDAYDKMTDNERQGKAAEILNQSRTLGMKRTQAELELLGIKAQVDPTTGNLIGINIRTGERYDYGKVDLSEEDRVREDASKKGTTLKNQKDMALFESPIIEGRQSRNQSRGFGIWKSQETIRQENDKAAEERKFGIWNRQEDIREKNRVSDDKRTLERQAARDAQRASLGNSNSIRNRIIENRMNVNAEVALDPDKYTDIWVLSPSGQYELTTDMPAAGSEEHLLYMKIYNLLYQNTKGDQNKAPATTGNAGDKKYRIIK